MDLPVGCEERQHGPVEWRIDASSRNNRSCDPRPGAKMICEASQRTRKNGMDGKQGVDGDGSQGQTKRTDAFGGGGAGGAVRLAIFVKRCVRTATSRLEMTPEITCSVTRWRSSTSMRMTRFSMATLPYASEPLAGSLSKTPFAWW